MLQLDEDHVDKYIRRWAFSGQVHLRVFHGTGGWKDKVHGAFKEYVGELKEIAEEAKRIADCADDKPDCVDEAELMKPPRARDSWSASNYER